MPAVSRRHIFGKWVPEISPYCGPLYFSNSLESPLGVSASGSFGLVDTGRRKLLVTCRHVWDGFQPLRDKDPALKIFVCLQQGNPVVLTQSPIALGDDLDIATFDMDPLLPACRGNKFFRLDHNPPRNLTQKNYLFFLGYPGCWRSSTSEAIQFGRVPYATSVSSVDGFRFRADISKAVYEDDNPRPPEQRHGGISGSPCFYLRRANVPLKLVEMATSFTFGQLGFVHLQCLNADGTIKTSPPQTRVP